MKNNTRRKDNKENENYLQNTSSPTYPQVFQEEKMIINYEKPILKNISNSNQILEVPPPQKQTNYTQEFYRLYIANYVLTSQIKEMKSEKQQLEIKLQDLQDMERDDYQRINQSEEKKKRVRRGACDIDRHYKCPVSNCEKSYGSEGSLNQHLKLKHPQQYEQHLQHLQTMCLQKEKQQKVQQQIQQQKHSQSSIYIK